MTIAPDVKMFEETMDRISPTRRPPGPVVMRQRWLDLLFLHWSVPVEPLQALLPPGLTLDTFEGRAYIGLVPFTMRGVRPAFLPAIPPLSNFAEVNVRTYVHHQGQNPGVWFFSLDAANSVAVRIARAAFKLPYFYAEMAVKENSGEIHYKSRRRWPGPIPAHCVIRYEPSGEICPAVPGTLDHFLAERYILYSHANGKLYRGRVHHTPYPLQTAAVSELEEDLIAAAGIVRPDAAPIIHFARSVDVRIFPLRRAA